MMSFFEQKHFDSVCTYLSFYAAVVEDRLFLFDDSVDIFYSKFKTFQVLFLPFLMD